VRPRQGRIGVWRGQAEVAAHADEHFHVAGEHRLDRVDGVQAVLTRWGDGAHLLEPIQQLLGRAVIDAAGAVALDIAVAPHR
jgi:hypothetical protein